MSSNESNSSNESQPVSPSPGRGTSPTVVAAVCLVLLAALVWMMAPGRAKFTPAPLRDVPLGCAQPAHDFVPSDATEVPGADLHSFSAAHRNHILYRLNMEPCSCGCNVSIAACRISHANCPVCKGLVEKVIQEESATPSGN